MHSRARILIPVLLVVVLGAGLYWWWTNQQVTATDTLGGSGTIEADDVVIAPEMSGRIAALPFDEGQDVQPGDTLVELDDALLKAQLAQAAAGVQFAKANLALLTAGPREEEVTQAEAAVAQARAVHDGATKANAAALLAQSAGNPAAGQASLQASVDSTKTQVAVSRAQLDQAEARLAGVRAGARPEQVQAAEAQLAQAEAAHAQVEVQMNKSVIRAPIGGVVLSRAVNPGEFAAVGSPLLAIGALDTVTLTIYVAETEIGRITPGQRVNVTVDSFSGRTFDGTISSIAQNAQFTPRNVQTKDERATTVFAVRIGLPNADHALKPGVPADAEIIQ